MGLVNTVVPLDELELVRRIDTYVVSKNPFETSALPVRMCWGLWSEC